MARYLTMHTLACLTRQGAEQLAAQLHAATEVTVRRVLLNLIEGKMLVEFEAADRERLEKYLDGGRLRPDWLLRIEYEAEGGSLVSL
jgi:hypothetical protein